MNRDTAKQYIKDQLESYLRVEFGVDPRKTFCCLNPDHNDTNPSMSYDNKRNKAHCFSCGADYDTFDLVAIKHNINKDNHAEVFNTAYNDFRLEIDTEYQNQDKNEQRAKMGEKNISETEKDYTNYFKECTSRIDQTDYLQKRGITKEVADKYMIGYEPEFKTKNAINGNYETWQALIIPTGKGNYIARNTDEAAHIKNRIRRTGKQLIYNHKIIGKEDACIFIAEGEIDALSIIVAGGKAIGLGGVANVNGLLKLLETVKPKKPFLISLDNDDQGSEATEKLIEGLERLNISYYRVDIAEGFKDANEALLADKEAFTEKVLNTENIEAEIEALRKEKYLQNSAAHHIEEFKDGIEASVNTPCISTGFDNLDYILDGGLYEGLYIIGAISSLGKTTLIMQIGDQIAQKGKDVLIFSLEMARTEIMAKSISRHTKINSIYGEGNEKTARGITDGKRYNSYTVMDLDGIDKAIGNYNEYAEHLFIYEGIGDIGVEGVREAVEQHIEYTGNTPIVIIDYLQILAPSDPRATDKQNTDKAVLELKRISRDYKLPLIGISSLNRANYSEKIGMEAFKESGAIEYSSDVLIGLQLDVTEGERDDDGKELKRKELIEKAKQADPRKVELIILKNRHGKMGVIAGYDFYPAYNYFEEREILPF